MNGYGHFLKPYLWIKGYWFVFGLILLLLSSLIIIRGTETALLKRLRKVKSDMSKPMLRIGISAMLILVAIGSYIFYNTNVLNTNWTATEEQNYRAKYEKTLKPLEYLPQPKITDVSLAVELYPESRSYEIKGTYTLKNTSNQPIAEVHIQKLLASHVTLKNINFEGGAIADSTYREFDYTKYRLAKPLNSGDSIKMDFEQSYYPEGFEDENSDTQLVYNGSFFNNSILPSLGYNRKYEINDKAVSYTHLTLPTTSRV